MKVIDSFLYGSLTNKNIISVPELELGQRTLFYGLSFLKTRLVRKINLQKQRYETQLNTVAFSCFEGQVGNIINF